MRSQPTEQADGLLLVDKPAGVTSHDVVLAARRALGEKRIGHAGTLDPFATGLLVLLCGRATRLLPYVSGEPKVYQATIRFGVETDTEDLDGEPVRTAALPTRHAIEGGIPRLTGDVEQVPPQYSAKRVGGRRAYEAARAGETLELRATTVRVFAWRVIAWRGADGATDVAPEGAVAELDVEITCGGGTYVRSLARDLARSAGSAAHLAALRRVRSGSFRVDDAVSLEALRDGAAPLLAPRAALGDIAEQPLDEDGIGRVVRGQEVAAEVAGDRAALMNGTSGVLVALAERRGDRWQPRVVMRRA